MTDQPSEQRPSGEPTGAGGEARPPLSAGKRIVFTLIAMLIPLGLAEIAAQILYRPPYIYIDNADGLDFRLVPGADLGDGIVLNDRGFNDRDWPIEKPAGTMRIVCVGDSFTFGVTPRDETIPTVLGEVLGERIARPVEVHNLGVSAYGTDQQAVMLEREGLPRDPDVAIVFFYVGNDVRDNARRNDRRAVHGKLVRGSRAHWRRRLLRSFALYRFFDDRDKVAKESRAFQAGLAKVAEGRALARAGLVAELRGAGDDEAKRRDLTGRAVVMARAAAVEAELLEGIDPALWLDRERAVVDAAIEGAERAVAEAADGAAAADAVEAHIAALEATAEAERRKTILGPTWIGIHRRFAPTYFRGSAYGDADDREKFETGWAETERILGEAKAACVAKGTELRVVILPSEVQVDERATRIFRELLGDAASELQLDEPQRRATEICQRLGLASLDVLPLCRLRDREERLFHHSNAHLNARGNRIVAEAVAAWLVPELGAGD